MNTDKLANRLGFLAIASALVLSGCLGASNSPAETAVESTSEDAEVNAGDASVSAGSDGAQVTAGGQTTGAKAPAGTPAESVGTKWVKDYWGAQQTLTLLDVTGNSGQLIGAAGQASIGYGAFFELPAGKVVPPGTSELEITFVHTPAATTPQVDRYVFDYGTAATDDIDGQDATPGTPIVIKVGSKDADAPLSTTSNWWFWIRPVSTGTDGWFLQGSDVAIKVVAKRAPTLPSYPEPADPWNGAAKLDLIKGATNDVTLVTSEPAFGNFIFAGSNGFVIEKGIVPPGTKKIVATLTWTSPGASVPVLSYYHDMENFGPMTVVEDGDMSRTFEFAVPEKLTDSPYAERSLYEFWFNLEGSPAPVGVTGPGTYTLDLSATK